MPKESGYKTVDEAIIAAMEQAIPLSKDYEYGGVIYKYKGAFYFTAPGTSKSNRHVNITARFPKGSKLLALYHTHPPGDESDLFSGNDVTTSQKLKLPYYMGSYADGSIKVFTPGKSETKKRGGRLMLGKEQNQTSEGELFGILPSRQVKDAFTTAVESKKEPEIGKMFTGIE